MNAALERGAGAVPSKGMTGRSDAWRLLARASVVLLVALCAFSSAAQTSSQKAAVQLSATVLSSPVGITLNWTSLTSTTSITIQRKLRTSTSWSSLATPSATATSYTDNTVVVGQVYEYKVTRVAGGVTGTGYICTGINVAAVDYRGKLVLLVDNTFSTSLSTELTQLVKDLRADGWAVVRTDLARTASVATVKSTILSAYNSDPSNVKAVFIVGHLAVPYSGNIAPDGHSEHTGAWPCDGYYGELNGTWTDASVNSSSAQRTENRNIPGDGKFDQSNFPSDLELQVGRIDFFDMPAFSTSETELMRAYLNKLHAFKIKNWAPTVRGLVFDNLQWVGNPLAASAWRNIAPLVGPANITAANQNGTPFHSLVNGQSYLWTYSSGGGTQATDGPVLTYNGASNVGTTQNYASTSMSGVFNMAMGSYFGDWDNRNNFLRAPLASGQALTNCWAGIPAWYFHTMGMGENIGAGVLATMNNSSLYTPLTDGWQSTIGRSHLALMGDPTLRQSMVKPPTNLVVTNASGTASFSWTASAESVTGYYIYEFNSTTGAIVRLNTNPVTTTTWSSAAVPFVAGREYMVRAVRLETSTSGSYFNLSLGALATAQGTATADCTGVVGGSAIPGSACNDGNACTVNDTWNANCQCVGTSSAPVASITAATSTTFCTGGSVALNAATGTGYTYVWRRNGTAISGATASSYTASIAGSYSVQITSSAGCASTSSAITVTVNALPTATITAGGATTFCTGGAVTLNANTGTGLTYQWRRNGTTISGATTSSYGASVAGTYTVVVTSGGCSTTSSGVVVTVNALPAATITPASGTAICSGSSVILNANTGTGLTYQWRLNGTAINGATGSSYTATGAGAYTVSVTSNGCTATSSSVSVIVGTSPSATITASGGTTFCSGGSTTLTANTGTGLTYQWRLNGTAITGATSSTYTATAAGTFTVVVTSGTCSTTSAGTSVVMKALPVAQISAAGATGLCTGGSVVLNATTGTGYSYQWRRNGTAISGATASSYTASTAGSYTVVVTLDGCTNTSASVAVTVNTAPTATITAGGATTFCSGGSVTLTANAGTALTYQWRRNGTAISGATANSYSATLAGTYTVVVTSGGCSTTSAGTTVAVNTAPTAGITAGGALGFCTGGSVTLSASTGTGYTYVWRRNGTTISGATSNTYVASIAGSYTVVITAGGCSTTSSAVTVTVSNPPTASISATGPTTFCTGGSVTLSTTASASNTYQWRRNGTAISGATSSSYQATLAGTYTVVVTSGGCASTSAGTTVAVNSAPSVTCSVSGSTISTSVSGGTAPYTYSWSGGGTGSSFTASASGSYTVTVTGANGCAATCSGSVTVASLGGCTGIRTEAQGTWGAPATSNNPASYMTSRFAAVFPAPNYLTIGCGTRLMRFSTPAAVIATLPTYGSPALLASGTVVNPGNTVSNTMVGQLVALKLNVRFDETDAAFMSNTALLRDMVIATGPFVGWTVQQLITVADQAIGGCSSTYSLSQLSTALANVNNGYDGGVANTGFLTCPSSGMALDDGSMFDADTKELEAPGITVAAMPNPFTTTTELVLTGAVVDGPTSIEVYTATGQRIAVIFAGTLDAAEEHRFRWDASGQAQGMYLYRVTNGEQLLTGRLLIQ